MLQVLFLVLLSLTGCFADWNFKKYDEDNEPLLLTPYIEQGRIKEGREAARVPPLLGSIHSYSGFFTVDKEYHSNLFFWYFPAEETSEKDDSAPVILWLNGGPGVTSMYGLLLENGPISLGKDNTLAKRAIHWSKHCHMIYIDNPVGVGFSFTDRNGLVNNETQISTEMHNALVQFFQIFPYLSKNSFFVAGESYAGRYVPAIAYEIHRSNPTSKVNINLKGVMIGSFSGISKLFNDTLIRKHLHVGQVKFTVSNMEINNEIWQGDGLMNVSSFVEVLLEHYRVMYYNGQLDLTLPYYNCETYAERLQWSGAPEYHNAARNQWIVGGELAGFFRSGGNLTLVLVRNSGHMVPLDQPEWAFDLVTKFVNDQHMV
ncbi:hypothetical protein GE061_000491 [Apolygus lucorum]|uniref:Carboxypeptidase n=1 Tax=Apolygus lucorum TaxID=248454 RepID=A0A6A4KBF2_APOLU|nr:hypothetical protein GE061_000491 [Apolygus lucorum]